MTLGISELKERVAAKFPDVEQVDECILRFTRTLKGIPYAVYYLDISQGLPASKEELAKYQDRVIGTRYFEGRKSLQWSNYLYFITQANRLSDSEMRNAKGLIEGDRSYARKFVILEEDFDKAIVPTVIVPATASLRPNILSIWMEELTKKGLDKVILSDDSLPTRLTLIESSEVAITTKTKGKKRKTEINKEPFLRCLELNNFRDLPRQRSFTFGKVNLIYGVNGSGKTSLLEAIELFYSGRNKRNPDINIPYELTAVFEDGRSEIATDRRKPQTFRDRHLNWYGQSEVKTNNLYQSFAQFNFLDTDAAVSLGNSSSRIEEDLAKLLVGPDASKTWRNMERVFEAVTGKLQELHSIKMQIEEELVSLEKGVTEAGTVRWESDLIRDRLLEMMQRLGWRAEQENKEKLAGSLVKTLSEMMSITQQTVAIDWTESPVSINGLAKYCREGSVIALNAEQDIKQFENMEMTIKHLMETAKRNQEALNLASNGKRLIDVGVCTRSAERTNVQSAMVSCSELLDGIESVDLSEISPTQLNETVIVTHDKATLKRLNAESLLEEAKNRYWAFGKQRDRTMNLAQELRQIAAKILDGNPKPDECPLCHTQFGLGELEKRINLYVDEELEVLGQRLISELREREAEASTAATTEATLRWLKSFCARRRFDTDVSVEQALSEIENAKQTLEAKQQRLEVLNAELLELESRGFSLGGLEEIVKKLGEIEYCIPELTGVGFDQILSAIADSKEDLSHRLEAERKGMDEIKQRIAATLGASEYDVPDFRARLSRLKERVASTESLLAKVEYFSSLLPWSGEKPLAKLLVESESIRNVANDLQAAIEREKRAKAIYTESCERKAHLNVQLSDLTPRLIRLNAVETTLKRLLNDHSLKGAVDSALNENRAAIESIFGSIHSPDEFRGLGSTWTTLIRKADGREDKLSEVSTGQRAAFALSIFLAQNSQLKIAPPVVLIDDPIAHVDDLNSLSFLDYLREIVLQGERQIFFSTANDKLASLFERKFDFLGDGLRRFNLKWEL